MTFDEVVVLLCSAVWLLHIAQLARLSLERIWPAWIIALVGLAITLGSYFLLDRGVAAVAAGTVVVFLFVPAMSTQAASRALKWGRIRRARLLSNIAFAVRPIAGQRVFRRAVELAYRLDRGEQLDIAASVRALGALTSLERAIQEAALLSWTNRFEALTSALADGRARRAALRAGMGAIVITAVGETRDDAELRRAYRELCDSGALGRQLPESIWALIAAAAYLGDVDGVREHTGEHRADAPPERLAFFVATAEQRAGHPERARGTIEAALARARSGHSARSRLQYRLDHPLEPAPQGEPFDALRADVSRRLDALRTLAPLRVSMRRPAPLTLGVAVSLALAFFWQLSQPTMDASFTRLGLVSPFDRAPDLHRLLSYGWLHLDSGHLLMNLVGLALFGRFVERHFEMARFVVIYLAGVLAGGAAYLAWERQTLGVAIGASGAVLALFGATVARIGLDRGVRSSPQGRRELAFLATIAALQLIIDAFWAQSSGSAHAGGLAAGLLLGALLRPRRRG